MRRTVFVSSLSAPWVGLALSLSLSLAACGQAPAADLLAPAAPVAPATTATTAATLAGWYDAQLDRLESSAAAADGRVAAAVSYGQTGGGSLLLLSRQGQVRELLRTAPDTALATPMWAADGQSVYYVVKSAATWDSAGAPGAPQLQHHGRLYQLALASGQPAPIGSANDVARVLGSVGNGDLLITRYLPGDLPQERPYLVDPLTGSARALLPAAALDNLYELSFANGRLSAARTREPFVTMPDPHQQVDAVDIDLSDGSLRTMASVVGKLPAPRADASVAASLEENAIVPALALSMPYVHQVYDTPDSFNGNWACGPTSTVMAIAHFGKLPASPITISIPTRHTNNYGGYISNQYTLYGSTFNRSQNDPSGHAAHGGYGWCTDGGGAWAYRMQDYAKRHQLHSDFDGDATFAEVKTALDAGKVVVLSTELTSAGHIITIKGYTSDGKLIANDPYGNKNSGYMNYKGEGAVYTWAQVGAKWFITVY